MVKSPLSPTRQPRTWRTLRFRTLLVLSMIIVGASFFLQGKILIEARNKNSLKREVLLSALTLDRSIVSILATQQRDPVIEQTIQPQLDALNKTTQSTAVMIIAEAADKNTLEIRLSSAPQRRDDTITFPPDIIGSLRQQPDMSVVIGSGGTLMAFMPIRGTQGDVVAFLGMERGENAFIIAAESFGLSLILLFITSVVLWALIRRYTSQGNDDAVRQFDANRLALMELATHQLGAPLASFKWWLELLQDPDGKELWGNKEVTMQIQEGVTRMESIIKALTEANEVAAQGANYKLETLASLKDILRRGLNDAASHLQRRKQVLKIFLDPQLDPVQLDPKLLFGVLQEVIENAIDYSPDNTTLEIHVTKEGRFAQVAIKDQGYGIPPQDLPHIFEKFTRASNAAQYKPVGNGLGLFIAKGIIHNLGGDMWIESKLGKGTTIFFTLPFDHQGAQVSMAKK